MVGSFCAGHCSHQQQEQHPNYNMHKFLHHQLCSSPKQSPQVLQDLNIPPRKLLSLRAAAAAAHSPSSEHIMAAPDSPDSVIALMQKFLPYNGEPCRTGNTSNNTGCCKDDDFDPDADPYSSDQFRMFEFKIRRCTRSRSHDWTDCPFAHPGEKAKRRDPRKYHYSGTVCPEYRRGGCGKGDDCEFAHGVFECWLHPSRYRTEACKDGKKCKRKVCFFAHSSRELRVLPPQADVDGGNNYDHKLLDQQQQQYCCKCCSLSPTSTLIGGNGTLSHFSSSPPMSPTLSSSPPISPTMKGRSGFPRSSLSSPSTATSRYAADWMSGGGEHVSYEDVIMKEIVSSLGAMNLSRRHRDELMAAAPACGGAGGGGLESSSPNGKIRRPWVDVNFEHYQQHQPEFHVLSPSTTSIATTDLLQSPIPSPIHDHDSSVGIHNNFFSGTSPAPVGTDSSSGIYGLEDKVNMDPDLGWVNDLLT